MFWETILQFYKKLNIKLPYDPAIPLWGINPKERKAGTWKGICTPWFIATIFTVAKRWKQPKYLLMDEWINKIRHIHKINYYWGLKKKEILIHTTTWKNKVLLYHSFFKKKDFIFIYLFETEHVHLWETVKEEGKRGRERQTLYWKQSLIQGSFHNPES